MEDKLILREESYQIIGACMNVHRKLGSGFLESVYQEALEKELKAKGVPFQRQKQLNIYYDGKKLNKYFVADFVCFDQIILEIKAAGLISKNMEQQVINYLRSTNIELGILVNFGEKSLTWKRFVNTHKQRQPNPRNRFDCQLPFANCQLKNFLNLQT